MTLMGVGGCLRSAFSTPLQKFDFDIPPGEIHTAVDQFAAFTGVQIAVDANLTGKTQGVHGQYTTEEGLMVMARSAGLVCERLPGASQFSVHPPDERQPGRTCLVFAPSPPLDPVPPAPAVKEAPPPEIDVHGRRPPGTHSHYTNETGSPMMSWNGEQIRITGAQVVADILENSTQNVSGGPSQDTHVGSAQASDNSGLGTGGNLRGLGSNSTLVLFNGHVVALSGIGASFTDLLQFPLSIVTKVYLMPDSASGIYGTEAVGGVIEIESLEHYIQPESHLEFGTVTDGHQEKYRFSQLFGRQWDGGSALIAAELMQWDALPAFERALANAARVPYSNPGNLITSTGTYPIPPGHTGQNLDFSTLGLGTAHWVNPQLAADILPSQRRWAIYGSLEHQFNPSVSLWTYVLGTQRDGQERLGGQEVYLNVTQSPFLLHAPQGAIFEEYNLLSDFGTQTVAVNVRTLNAALELQINLPGHWLVVLSGSSSLETEALITTGQVDPKMLQSDVSNPKVTEAFNPFGNGSITDATVLQDLNVPKWFNSRSQVRSYTAIADGPIVEFQGEPLLGVVGIEARDQLFTWSISQPYESNDLRRLLYAGFLEFKVPLLGETRFAEPFRNLALSIAGRIERYHDFGGSATPRIGMSWVPFSCVELRGAWALSVRAPDLGDLSQKNNSSRLMRLGITPTFIWSGGSPNVTVERALTRTAGLRIRSDQYLPQFTFDLSYFDILSRDRIVQVPLTATVLTDPQYSSYVTHSPSPVQQRYVCNNSTFVSGTHEQCLQSSAGAIVDLRLHNAGTLWTDGIDTQASLAVDSPIGRWGWNLAATYILHYRQSTLPKAPLVSALDTETNPLALHALAGVTWQAPNGSWLRGTRADVTQRYANGYYNNQTQPPGRVGSSTTTDLRLAYTFGGEDSARGFQTEISVLVKDLFDKYPPYSDNLRASTGYDQENGDLTGREVMVSFHVRW